MLRFFTLVFFVVTYHASMGQASEDYSARSDFDPNESTVTKKPKSKKDKFDHTKTANYPKKLDYIVIDNPAKVLYGNPCVEEVTQKMGFKYQYIPDTRAPGYVNTEDPTWHNIKTHFKLMFKNGPFYKSKVRKAIKRCRKSSGDFVG